MPFLMYVTKDQLEAVYKINTHIKLVSMGLTFYNSP